MSFAARNIRTVARAAPRTRLSVLPRARTFATTSEGTALEKFLEADKALQHHAAETTDLWRKISYYACLPGIAVCAAWVYNVEAEHAAHIEHLKKEQGGHLPEPPAYDYLNRRGKPFPWGDNSVFFNPHTNKDMSIA